MYDVKINTYDPVSLEKLQMELDIPWNDEPLDTYQLYQLVQQAKKVKSK
jgi:hypothetical protein